MADDDRAFPVLRRYDYGLDSAADGMSLRDWFAGQAIAGLADSNFTAKTLAESAHDIADAMMSERAARAKQRESSDEHA